MPTEKLIGYEKPIRPICPARARAIEEALLVDPNERGRIAVEVSEALCPGGDECPGPQLTPYKLPLRMGGFLARFNIVNKICSRSVRAIPEQFVPQEIAQAPRASSLIIE